MCVYAVSVNIMCSCFFFNHLLSLSVSISLSLLKRFNALQTQPNHIFLNNKAKREAHMATIMYTAVQRTTFGNGKFYTNKENTVGRKVGRSVDRICVTYILFACGRFAFDMIRSNTNICVHTDPQSYTA